MTENKTIKNYIANFLENIPDNWINLTTHRLDIYNEELAKVEFLQAFENLYESQIYSKTSLEALPTAYDYIRLGHPLSCVLEWAIAKTIDLPPEQVISFSSQSMPLLAILRKNSLAKKPTQILYTETIPSFVDEPTLKEVYGFDFQLKKIEKLQAVPDFEGESVFIAQNQDLEHVEMHPKIDFYLSLHPSLGSLIYINSQDVPKDIVEIQHVRRRETIAMTPTDCLKALRLLVGREITLQLRPLERHKYSVMESIKQITHTHSNPLLGSSGLSVQYAIMMGLIDDAITTYPGKPIKIIVPPNCYGGTNDQARRVAASLSNVAILDLPVDGDHDMVQSTDLVLDQVAEMDAIPLIIAEIPTNPRVEVPDLVQLKQALTKKRQTQRGEKAIEPIFILDQTFCPNFNFLGENQILSQVKTISYVSGSKFPSGGKCTAGYVVANEKAAYTLAKIEKHFKLCDNEATPYQMMFLSQQLPSMLQRIKDAYTNTREFVNFIQQILPSAKINFVSEELAEQGFTPSVFSLDLPTKGDTHEEREAYKRELNKKLINKMISEIPNESKYCVSYGQLKGCYWTIPATSTQGTTQEKDKDYIARVSVSPDLDLEKHKQVFQEFVSEIG